jgi:glycosyltransferase involved in cell wall biosynthesis
MLRKARTTHWRTAFFLHYADVLITNSKACAQSVKHHVSMKTVHQIYNGIELDEFQLDVVEARRFVRSTLGVPEEHLVVVNAGAVCARNGQEYGIQAATEVLKSYSSVTFAFLGDLDIEPEYVRRLKAQVADLQMEGRVQFLGFRDDFPRFLVGADIFLHTVVRDPHPIVVLGAMAARLPGVTRTSTCFNTTGIGL